MNILYVGNFADRDSPLGYCPNAWWIAQTFRKLGHDVTCMNESAVDANDVLMATAEQTFDFILCEEGRLRDDHQHDEKTGETVIRGFFNKVMEHAGVPIVPWLTNIFHSVMRREIELKVNPIFKSQIVFSTDGGHDERWKEMGINHRLLRQGIYEPEAYIGKKSYPTKAEIAFVGGVYEEIWPYRKQLIDELTKTYKDRFLHVGQRGEVRHDQLNNLCATVKIVVGDSVYSPNYWSNRVYEIIGRGGFLIMPMIDGLEKEFTPYKHFVPYTFGDFEGLKEKINYFLRADEERERIRLAGFEYCKANYTYTHRVKDMLSILEKEKII